LNTLATSSPSPTATLAQDTFFPSGYFAKVPTEALGSLAFEGHHRMEHSEFRLFVALCRFRGRAQLVNPSQETLAKMTGMTRNNVSRAAHGLKSKGWATLHHKDGNVHKSIANYELHIPIPGTSPGVMPMPKKVQKGTTGSHAEVDVIDYVDCASASHEGYEVEVDSEPMSEAELDAALALQMTEEA
jgi:hypothetical protein